MATTPEDKRPVTAEAAAANKKVAARVAEEARLAAVTTEALERQPGDDLDAEDLAQFDG